MATTKYTLAEQALRILAGGNLKPDRNIDIREVMMYIDQVRDELIVASVYQSIKENDFDVDSGYLTYYPNVAVTTDTTTGLKTAALPATRISLPKDLGLYSVSAPTTNDDPYIPMRQGQMWQFKNSKIFDIASKTFYYPAGENIYFKNIPTGVTAVLVILVASSKSLGEDDVYAVPPDVEKKLVDAAIERFGIMKQIPHDSIEDGIK